MDDKLRKAAAGTLLALAQGPLDRRDWQDARYLAALATAELLGADLTHAAEFTAADIHRDMRDDPPDGGYPAAIEAALALYEAIYCRRGPGYQELVESHLAAVSRYLCPVPR